MSKFKRYMPYILLATVAIVLFGFGKKLLQTFGLVDSDAETLAKNQQKDFVKVLVNQKPDEGKLSHPVSFFVDLASQCYHLNHDFFDGSYDKKVMSILPTLNIEDVRQLCRSYVQFSPDKTLWQDVQTKWGAWYTNMFNTSPEYTAFEAALSRANLKV